MGLFQTPDVVRAPVRPPRKTEDQLHECAALGRLTRAEELLHQGFPVNGRDGSELTPLHWAVNGGHLSMVQLLLDHRADVNATHPGMGSTPLHIAANLKRASIAQLLIASGADINAETKKTRNTPLHLAATHDKGPPQRLFGGEKRDPVDGQIDTVKLLLEKRADTSKRNARGKTALELANASKFTDVAMLIANSGTMQSQAAARAPAPEVLVLPPAPAPAPTPAPPNAPQRAPSAEVVPAAPTNEEPPLPLPDLSSCADLQRLLAQYDAVLQMAGSAQAIDQALFNPVVSMEGLRMDLKDVDEQVRDLELQNSRNKQLLFQLAAAVRREATSQEAVADRDIKLSEYQRSLQALQAAYDRKANLSARRLEQKIALAGAQRACQMLVQDGTPVTPISQEDLRNIINKVDKAVHDHRTALAPAVAATQAALRTLQACLERQHAAAMDLRPQLNEACKAGGPVIAYAFQVLEQETPGDDLALAKRMQGALQVESQQLAALARQHASLRETCLRMAMLQRDLRELRNQARTMHAEILNAEDDGRQSQANKLRETLAGMEARRRGMEVELKGLQAPLLEPQFKELFPEASAVSQMADQLGRQLPANRGRTDDIIDPEWSRQNFKDPSGTPLGNARVRLVEDFEGKQWVIKELCRERELRREGGRLQALQHPLVVRLERIFFDRDLAFLQMPYCAKGCLRAWFEVIKGKTSQGISLNIYDRQQVYATMKQVFQAVAFIHCKGVVHRDLKPENILLQDDGRIALCDFGVSHDVFSQYQTTVATVPGGHTAAYAAPEVLINPKSASQHPFAQDLWSLGIMLLELELGDLPTFNVVKKRLELKGQPLEVTKARPSSSLQQDPWMASLRKLSARLLETDPSKRPTAEDALSDPDSFLARDLAQSQQQNQRHAHAVISFLETLRRSSDRSKTHRIKLASRDDLDTFVGSLLAEFSKDGLNLLSTLSVECNGVRLPLSEAMDRFFQNVVMPKFGLFEQGGGDEAAASGQIREGVAFLPTVGPADKAGKKRHLQQMRGVGRALAKAVLECLHVPVRFSTALCCYLVGDEHLAFVTPDQRLDMLEEFDAVNARLMRSTLALTHGNGQVLFMVAGPLLGEDSQDQTSLTDANKADVVRRAVQRRLVGVRQEALEALRKGFLSLDNKMQDQLELLTGQGMATLFFGQDYVDVDRAVTAFVFTDDWRQKQPAKKDVVTKWLQQFIREASEVGLRLLGMRAFGGIDGLSNGRCLVLPGEEDLELPYFDRSAGCVHLPINCTGYEAFRHKMEQALRAGEHAVRTDAQNRTRISREELDAVVKAMQSGGDQIRAGGWYQCPNGHVYAIGNCGGAMQEANCPTCGEGIGGQDHRLRGDNRHAPDMDGATSQPWS